MEADGFLSESQRRFLPRLVSLVEAPGMTDLASMTNLLKGRKAEQGITAYLSRGQTCKSPFSYCHKLGILLDQALRRGIKPF